MMEMRLTPNNKQQNATLGKPVTIMLGSGRASLSPGNSAVPNSQTSRKTEPLHLPGSSFKLGSCLRQAIHNWGGGQQPRGCWSPPWPAWPGHPTEGAWQCMVGGRAPCSGRIFSCFVHALHLYIFPRGKGVLWAEWYFPKIPMLKS